MTKIRLLFSNIFNQEEISYGENFIISMPYEIRRGITHDQHLELQCIDHNVLLPNWLSEFNYSYLGPYEIKLLTDILSSPNAVSTIRGGARSGKSSTIEHLITYSIDYTNKNTKLKEAIKGNTFIKKLHFEDSCLSLDESNYDKQLNYNNDKNLLSEEISGQLEECFLSPSCEREERYTDEHDFYLYIYNELFCSSMRSVPGTYNSIKNKIKNNKNFNLEEFNLEIFKICINTLPSELKFMAKILPFVQLGRRSKTAMAIKKSAFVLVLDNLDNLPIHLQSFLYRKIKELFKSDLRNSGLSVVLVVRHGSFIDPKGRFTNNDFISHNSISPAEAIYVKITSFLLNADDLYFDNLDVSFNDYEKNIVLKRAFALWFHLSDQNNEFYQTIDSIGGTNLQTAYSIVIEWLCSAMHKEGSESYHSFSKLAIKIVGNISFANLLYGFATNFGRGMAELCKRHKLYTDESPLPEEFNNIILNEMTRIVVAVVLNVKLFHPDKESKGKYALRCFVTYKLKMYYDLIKTDGFYDSDYYAHCVNGFANGFTSLYGDDYSKNIDLSKLASINKFYACNLRREVVQLIIKNNCIINNEMIDVVVGLVINGMNGLIQNNNINKTSHISKVLRKRQKHNSQYIYRGIDQNTTISSDFLMSSFQAGELILKISSGLKDSQCNLAVSNLFCPYGSRPLPLGIYILYILAHSKSMNLKSEQDSIINFLVTIGYERDDILKVILMMIGCNSRLIYSEVADYYLDLSHLESMPRDIYLSWAGKTFYEKLIRSPVYLEVMLENIEYFKPILDKEITFKEDLILKRIEYSYRALLRMSDDEINRFRFLKEEQGPYKGSTLLDDVRLPTFGIISDILITSSKSFFSILAFFHNISNVPTKISISNFTREWIVSLESINTDFNNIFDDIYIEWSHDIYILRKEFDHIINYRADIESVKIGVE